MDSGKRFGCLNASSACDDQASAKSDLQPFGMVYPWVSLGSVSNNDDGYSVLSCENTLHLVSSPVP